MSDEKPDRELTDAQRKVKENEKARQLLRAKWKAQQRAQKEASDLKKAEDAKKAVFYPPPEQPEIPEWDPDRFLDLPEPVKPAAPKPKRVKLSKPGPVTPRRQRIIDFLVLHPEYGTADLMVKFACGEKTVQRARAQAIEQGKLNPSVFDRKSPAGKLAREKGTGAEPVETAVRKLLEGAELGESELTLAESLSMLSKLAKGAEAEGQKKLAIDAVNAYHKLKSASIATKVGPGVPLTHEEKVERAARVLEAAGEQAARAAFLVAFAREAPHIRDIESPEIRRELEADPQPVETEM